MDNSNFVKLTDIKAFILERKILLNMMNDEYILYDSIVKIIHLIVSMIHPLVSLIDLLLGHCTDGLVTIVFGVSVIIIMKLREIFNYKKLQEQTKDQSVKYRQLYNRIKEEEDKIEIRRQPEDIFVYWIVREYNNIQLNDPDIPVKTNKKFIKLCKEHNIKWNTDINILEKLLNDFNSPIQSPIQSPRNRDVILNTQNEIKNINPRVRRLSHIIEKSEHEYKTLASDDNFKDDTQWTLTRLKNL